MGENIKKVNAFNNTEKTKKPTYKCEKTKKEIIEIIVSEFNRINDQCTVALKQNNASQQDKCLGKRLAMQELLQKLEILEK